MNLPGGEVSQLSNEIFQGLVTPYRSLDIETIREHFQLPKAIAEIHSCEDMSLLATPNLRAIARSVTACIVVDQEEFPESESAAAGDFEPRVNINDSALENIKTVLNQFLSQMPPAAPSPNISAAAAGGPALQASEAERE